MVLDKELLQFTEKLGHAVAFLETEEEKNLYGNALQEVLENTDPEIASQKTAEDLLLDAAVLATEYKKEKGEQNVR